MPIPIIDERIKHVGPASLRKMDALKLRGLRDLMVIQDKDEPIAVLIPYEMYLEMQKEVAEGTKAISTVFDRSMFQPEGPVYTFPEFNPDDYGKMPAGVPVAIDDGTEQPNGGTNQNPDMAYSKDSYIEPANERREVPRSGSTVNVPTPPVGTPQWCQHCGNPATSTLCGECFMVGHRAVANCQQCAEAAK